MIYFNNIISIISKMRRAFFVAVLVLSVVMGTASAYSTTTRKPATTTATPKLIGISANCTQNLTFCAVSLSNNGNTTSTCANLTSCLPLNATADTLMYVCGNLTGCALVDNSKSTGCCTVDTIVGLVVGLGLALVLMFLSCR